MRTIRLSLLVMMCMIGCGPNVSSVMGKTPVPKVEENTAIAMVERLAVQHGYHPIKMNLEVKINSETGDFSIFLFPKPKNAQHLNRELGVFALVSARSGAVIRFSDPRIEQKK